ncbi:MFS transporter [Halegenticoccus soli]|uniref:MFS transporter n=1 Tax=Halegenticoccus soli TaxID=1985678 RepID=UPI000C6E377E|nr:MFS transporter [Halegenticoccus soli]
MTATTTADETPESTGVPWRSPAVQIVLLSTALAPLGVPLVSPALPVIRDTFGVTDATASLLISSYFVAGIVLSPFIGALADRLGRKRVLVWSLAAFGLTGGAAAFAPTFEAVLALRAIGGVASAGIFISTITLIGDVFDGVQRNAVLGANNAVLSAGAAAFPILGGALVAVAWNVPFLAYFAAVPLAAAAFALLDEPERDGAEVRIDLAYLRGAARAVAEPAVLTMYAATFAVEFLLFGAVLTVLPFLLEAEYALAPVLIGVVITTAEASSIAVSMINGRLARRFSNGGLVAAGFACYGVGFLGAWLAPSPLAVSLAMLPVGAGVGLVLPCVDAEVSDAVSGTYRAGALSLRNSTTFLGRSAGPVAFAGLAATTGYPALLLATGVASFACAVGLAFATRGGVADGASEVDQAVVDGIPAIGQTAAVDEAVAVEEGH